MSTAVAKATTTAKSFMPTAKEAMDTGKDLGTLVGGMIGAHAAVTLLKKDSPIVNGGILIAGGVVAMKVKNPVFRMLALGAAAYGGIRLMNNGLKAVTVPESTEGLNGLLPESAKALIRKFIPTLSGMDEVAGYEDLNGDDDMNGLSLDDFGATRNDEPGSMEGLGEMEQVAGLGEAAALLA